MGVIPITNRIDFSSCAFNKNLFIPFYPKLNINGGCSILVVRVVVERRTLYWNRDAKNANSARREFDSLLPPILKKWVQRGFIRVPPFKGG